MCRGSWVPVPHVHCESPSNEFFNIKGPFTHTVNVTVFVPFKNGLNAIGWCCLQKTLKRSKEPLINTAALTAWMMKKLQTKGCPQLKASVLIIIPWNHSLLWNITLLTGYSKKHYWKTWQNLLCFQVLLYWFRSRKLEHCDVVTMLDKAEQLGYVQTETAEDVRLGNIWDDSYLNHRRIHNTLDG